LGDKTNNELTETIFQGHTTKIALTPKRARIFNWSKIRPVTGERCPRKIIKFII